MGISFIYAYLHIYNLIDYKNWCYSFHCHERSCLTKCLITSYFYKWTNFNVKKMAKFPETIMESEFLVNMTLYIYTSLLVATKIYKNSVSDFGCTDKKQDYLIH